MHTIWTGARVRLRPFADEHEYMALQDELHREPNDFWGAWWHPQAKLKKDYEDTGMLDAGKYSVFCIERLDTGVAVGIEECGPSLGVPSICGWVGTFVLRPHWSRGFGIEAKQLALCYLFENFPYRRVDAGTLANHKRAAAGLHRCGMSYEGRIHGAHYMDGLYHDIVCYRILREEWERLDYRHAVQRG